MKRIICVLAVLIGLILPAAASPDLNGGLGYFPYIYNSEGEPVATPAAYTSVKTITGETLGLGQLKDLSCIIYDNAGTVYIADSGNNRIVMLDNQYNLKGVIGPFDNNGTQDNFNNPTGLCAVDGKLYVADSANARILCFDGVSHQLIREFGRPVIETQAEDYVYEPTQLAVDYAGRMYVIAKGINQGLVQLDENGEFMSYMGAPKVSPTFTQIIRRWFATKEQAAALMKIVPTEYNAVKMDDKGFLYVTAKTQNVKPISRLNSQGENVLKYSKTAKMGYPSGDGDYADSTGAYLQTSFVDITVREDGSYLALDTLMGRVFAYDEGGSLLYVFGNMGALNGSFYSPSSLTAAGDDVLVTDRSKGSIDVFAPTDFGRCVNNAVGLQKEGYLPKAEEAWNQVLDQCSNYDIAYINLARIDIQNGNFSEAMEKLQATNEKYYYSQAFKEYRSEYISQRFTPIAILLVVLILVLIFVPRLVRRLAPVQRLSQTRVMREMRYHVPSLRRLLGHQAGEARFHCQRGDLLRPFRPDLYDPGPVQRLSLQQQAVGSGQRLVRAGADDDSHSAVVRIQLVFHHPDGGRRQPEGYLYRHRLCPEALYLPEHSSVHYEPCAHLGGSRVLHSAQYHFHHLGGSAAFLRHDDDPRLFPGQSAAHPAADAGGNLPDPVYQSAAGESGAGSVCVRL